MWKRDDPKKSWEQSINDAYKFYTLKYGHEPNVCYLHPRFLEEEEYLKLVSTFAEKGLSVERVPYVLKDCLWIGVEEKENNNDN